MLLQYLAQELGSFARNSSLLELGCGTGLISIVAEKAGAVVTSSDISHAAIENTRVNAERNQTRLHVIHSDLFDKIPTQTFSWIIINPPYYARTPRTEAESAWNCGTNFEYFRKLFPTLNDYISKDSRVLMTLAEGADVDSIASIALQSGFKFDKLAERHRWHEGRDYLFRVIPR